MDYTAADLRAGHRRRLQDRFLQNGLAGFSIYEIVELLYILGTPRKDCRTMAKRTVEKFGSLKAVLEAEPAVLREIEGVGPRNIIGIRLIKAVMERYQSEQVIGHSIIENSDQVIEYLRLSLSGRDRETFIVIYLNGRNQVVKSEELFQGTLTSSAVYPREVIKHCLANKAAALILVHNHPSGNLNPSKDDLRITRKLKAAAATIDVKIHDHLIITDQGYYSFADSGVL